MLLGCHDCGTKMPLKVLKSNAGHYVGRECPRCGPYDRYTGYYKTPEAAEAALPSIQAEEDGGEPAMSLAGDF